jgi:hypothetical protein
VSPLPIGDEPLSALLIESGEKNGVRRIAPHIFCVVFGGCELNVYQTMLIASRKFMQLCADASKPELIPKFKREVYRTLFV